MPGNPEQPEQKEELRSLSFEKIVQQIQANIAGEIESKSKVVNPESLKHIAQEIAERKQKVFEENGDLNYERYTTLLHDRFSSSGQEERIADFLVLSAADATIAERIKESPEAKIDFSKNTLSERKPPKPAT